MHIEGGLVRAKESWPKRMHLEAHSRVERLSVWCTELKVVVVGMGCVCVEFLIFGPRGEESDA